MSDDDDELIAAAGRGDNLAFRRLVERHSRAVFQLCWRITRDTALAEDATQEAFCKAWRGLDSFDGRAAFSTWLHRVAANAALEQLRRNARHRRELTDLAEAFGGDEPEDFLAAQASEQAGPDQHALGAEVKRRVEDELQSMSALERAAFVLRHVEGESLEVIARTLSLNIGQSKQAVFRAVRKLRGALQEWS